MPGKISTYSAQNVQGAGERAGQERVYAASPYGKGAGERTPASADGDHLQHRDPGFRGEIYHSRGHTQRKDRYFFKRQDPDNPAASKALPETAKVRKKTRHPEKADFYCQKWKQPFQNSDLERDESAL